VDLLKLALRFGIFAAVEEALPDHDQSVIDPAALRVILEDTGGLFNGLLIILHFGRRRLVGGGGGSQIAAPLLLQLLFRRELHHLGSLALLALFGGVLEELLGIVESIVIGATAEKDQRHTKDGQGVKFAHGILSIMPL